ncbi:DEAD/DEAH box helicase [Saccharopolyspora sp. HNM0986]|nr:DEAD/DEAH box helicase [Saccharopolyspora sp. HNM0986]
MVNPEPAQPQQPGSPADSPQPVGAQPRDPDTPASPAESYSAHRHRSAHPKFAEFAGELSFDLDPFQRTACQALESGHGALVCAPTGAGKTVVGEFAVHLALAEGRRCFYTTPIKALSNQKYADLCERHGTGAVGLLTGDTSINGDAQVVVMTTEVLRNMLYASSQGIDQLGYVVMDEVHYLADRFRGAVWEEVILHLPQQVQLASLSATVSNAEEFGEWLVEVRGDTRVVVDEHRPVPLWQHMLVGSRMFDLFGGETEDRELKLNPRLLRHTQELARTHMPPGRGRGGPPGRRKGPKPPKFFTPSRVEVLTNLDAAGLLPAIVFIFSRAGCDAAVSQCVRSGLRLTTEHEVDEIREVVEEHTASLPESDLEVLGYWEWRDALERGVAAHHAGLLPAFKETVEELFVRGLVKAVFATETLALGINMPARTVVLERLVKFNGESHVDLTPGEYTQLTGRAGRRGIDVEGHAVVIWQPGVDPKQVAGLASTRTYPLRSSFRPGYNMAVNLVQRVGRDASRDLLEQSFAQFQADRSVVGMSRRVERNAEALEGYAESMECHLGDFAEYFALRRRISDREKALAKQNRASRRAEAAKSLEKLRKGDVIQVPSGRRAGLAVVIDPGLEPMGEPRPLVLTEDRWSGRLSVADFSSPVEALGRMKLPKHVDTRSPKSRRDLASGLRETGIAPRSGRGKRRDDSGDDAELASLRRALKAHPCHGCDDREKHARWAERHERLRSETDNLRRKVATTTHSLARSFDRIIALLSERDYVTVDDPEKPVTEHGRRLSRLYSESDLLAAECLRVGVWDSLGPPELAAVVSSLVYESRREGPMAPAVPSGDVSDALAATWRLWAELEDDERRHKLDRTREPDPGFAWPVFRWARGESLERVLTAAASTGHELSAGDFVRWCRQVIDLLDQVAKVAGKSDPVGSAAAKAVTAIRRGVVAAGAV